MKGAVRVIGLTRRGVVLLLLSTIRVNLPQSQHEFSAAMKYEGEPAPPSLEIF